MATDLAHTEVLVLDCQTTGSYPPKAHLLEIGWLRTRAVDQIKTGAAPFKSFLVQLPQDHLIPRHVARLTGISDDAMQSAMAPEDVRALLWDAAHQIAALEDLPACPTVIHYARFEIPFLMQLHRLQAAVEPFPFHIICTHAISTRLLPQLPRKGLRAVAGYFGHSVPELKRSAHHVHATAHVWGRLVQMLARKEKIRTLAGITGWLASRQRPGRTARSYPLDPGKRVKLPDQPGIYRMLRSNGDVLYIGKAKSIRKRVASYFQPSRRHPEHILEMLSQARDIDCTVTPSAFEAAVCESNEIKRLNPPYNVALRSNSRQLCYLSRTHDRLARTPDRTHPVGPLPLQDDIRLLPLLTEALTDRTSCRLFDAESLQRYLNYYDGDSPGLECLEQGLLHFRQRHVRYLKNTSVARACLLIGQALWQQRVLLPDPDQQDDDAADERTENFKWTPVAVAELFDSILLRSTHWIRRSHWLCWLSEAVIIWDCARGPSAKTGQQHVTLQNGNLTGAGRRKENPNEILVPPGWAVERLSRQRKIDLKTYDRLRVVTTELRRLLAEDRSVEIYLRPGVCLPNARLSRLLQWI